MIEEAIIMRKVAKLPREDQLRVAEIFNAMSKIIHGMISCRGPDDARIAAVCAISTVFGIEALPDAIKGQTIMAHSMIDFIIEALTERRKRAEKAEAKIRCGWKPEGV